MAIMLYAIGECEPKPANASTSRKVTIFDLRDQFINKLRFYIGTFDWDSVLYVGNAGHVDMTVAYLVGMLLLSLGILNLSLHSSNPF